MGFGVRGFLGRQCSLTVNGWLVQSITDEVLRWETMSLSLRGRGQVHPSTWICGETREVEFSVIDVRDATYLHALADQRQPVNVVCTAHALQAIDAAPGTWRVLPVPRVEQFVATIVQRATDKPLIAAVSSSFVIREWGHPLEPVSEFSTIPEGTGESGPSFPPEPLPGGAGSSR